MKYVFIILTIVAALAMASVVAAQCPSSHPKYCSNVNLCYPDWVDCSTVGWCNNNYYGCASGMLCCFNNNPICFSSGYDCGTVKQCGSTYYICHSGEKTVCTSTGAVCWPGWWECSADSDCSGGKKCVGHVCTVTDTKCHNPEGNLGSTRTVCTEVNPGEWFVSTATCQDWTSQNKGYIWVCCTNNQACGAGNICQVVDDYTARCTGTRPIIDVIIDLFKILTGG